MACLCVDLLWWWGQHGDLNAGVVKLRFWADGGVPACLEQSHFLLGLVAVFGGQCRHHDAGTEVKFIWAIGATNGILCNQCAWACALGLL